MPLFIKRNNQLLDLIPHNPTKLAAEHLGGLEDYGSDIEDTGPNETFREYTINLGDGDSILAVEIEGTNSGHTHQGKVDIQ